MFEESDLHAHVWENEIVFLQVSDGDAYFDGGLLAVRRGDDGSHLCGERLVRMRIQRRSDLLPGRDLCYVGFVDVHFNLVGMHVHDRGDSRARKSAARGDGRNHLSDLGIFRNHNAGEGGADGAIVHRLLRYADTSLGGSHLLPGEDNLGLEAVHRRGGIVECLLRLDTRLLELLGAAMQDLRVPELNFVVRDGGMGGVTVGLRGIERAGSE